jgi:tetratricopeptide (TPR) repeat protein
MFGQFAARIKAAEEAFEKGRLDDAFEIAAAMDLIGQRRAEELLAKMAEPFLYRGQDHLLGKRFAEALTDVDRAARCGCPAEKVADWRRRATQARADVGQAETERQAALAAARERLASGSLPGAADALARLGEDDPDRAAVADEMARRKQRAEQALTAARSALDDGQVARAIENVRAAKSLHAKLDGLAATEARVLAHVVGEATRCFTEGRLDRAAQELAALGDLGRGDAQRGDLEETLRLAREAARALADDRYSKAAVLLGRLTQIGPKAEWIAQVREHLNVLDERRRALLAGPLGLLLGREVPSEISIGPLCKDRPADTDETLPLGRPAPAAGERAGVGAPPVVHAFNIWGAGAPGAGGPLPKRLLLRIDGVGSFLLLRSERVSIGHAGPGATADLPLVSDLAERQAEVIRAGEDYFVVSSGGVELADRRVDYALLQNGDRVRLGKRIRLKFLRPSQKSATAVLELGDGVRTTTDCRRVILWSGPLLMGSTSECHIPLAWSGGGAILLERDGRVLVKPMAPGTATAVVPLGAQAELGELRLTLQEWPGSPRAGKVVG